MCALLASPGVAQEGQPGAFAGDGAGSSEGDRNGARADEPDQRLRLVVAWGNDRFDSLESDDAGFTQDAVLEGHLLRSGNDLALRVRHRMITEIGGSRRTDEFTWQARWLREQQWGPFLWTYGPLATLALSGNYGGVRGCRAPCTSQWVPPASATASPTNMVGIELGWSWERVVGPAGCRARGCAFL